MTLGQCADAVRIGARARADRRAQGRIDGDVVYAADLGGHNEVLRRGLAIARGIACGLVAGRRWSHGGARSVLIVVEARCGRGG